MTEKKSKKEKKKICKPCIWGFVIVLLIASSVFIFFGMQKGHEPELLLFDYNNYSFIKDDNGLWSVALEDYVDIDGNPFILKLHNTPFDVEQIHIEGDIFQFFPSNNTYLTHDPIEGGDYPDLRMSIADLTIKLAGTSAILQNGTLFNPKIVCSNDGLEVCSEVGIITCETTEEHVISFEKADKNSIRLENNCLTLSATKEEFSKVEDRLLYVWFGIMNQ